MQAQASYQSSLQGSFGHGAVLSVFVVVAFIFRKINSVSGTLNFSSKAKHIIDEAIPSTTKYVLRKVISNTPSSLPGEAILDAAKDVPHKDKCGSTLRTTRFESEKL